MSGLVPIDQPEEKAPKRGKLFSTCALCAVFALAAYRARLEAARLRAVISCCNVAIPPVSVLINSPARRGS